MTLVKDLPNQQVRVQRIFNEQTGEVELYCHSQVREEKERAIEDRFAKRFEAAQHDWDEAILCGTPIPC